MKNTENQINIPIAGMDRDSHPSRVKENTFTFANNITFEEEQSLSQIAKMNSVSPKFIYDLLRKNFEKDRGVGNDVV